MTKKVAPFDIQGIHFDTMIAAFLLASSDRRYGLDDVLLKYVGEHMRSYTDLVKDAKGKPRPLTDVPFEEVMKYACHDADAAGRLEDILRKKLEAEGLWKVFTDIEMPLVPILARMQEAGIGVDVPFLEGLRDEIAGQLLKLETTIYDEAGEKFNIHSPKQLQEILFVKLKLDPVKKTKTGYSTNVQVLEVLQHRHPLPALILEYRHLSKLQSTYIEALPRMVNPETGRIHTTFNQTGAATGRFSSTDPNLQNIPIRTEVGRQIRKAFVAKPGCVLVAADYSQLELRLLAHFSNDEMLIDTFQKGGDIHTRTAALMFDKAEEEISRDERRAAKTINFGVMYGMGAFRLSNELQITRKEAEQFIDAYFKTYAGVRYFIERTLEDARERMCVETLYGRKRYIPEINNRNRNLREAAEREAFNAVIQGTEADLMKIAMINIDREFQKRGLKSMMLLQVHDEFVFEVPKEELEEVTPLIVDLMSHVADLRVPLDVEISSGHNWLEAH